MGWMDTLKNIGDAAADAAKTAGGKAQDLAKAAQEKAAYLKEVNNLKTAIRAQKAIIAENRSSIADKVLAELAAGGSSLPEGVIGLADNIKAAEERITGLQNQIEDLKATAAVKNPDIEREINQAIAEIDKKQAVDIEPAAEDIADEATETAAADPAAEKPAE